MTKETIYVCQDRWCHDHGAARILKKVRDFFVGTYEVEGCRCLGYCEQGVNAMKSGRMYHDLTEENVIGRLEEQGNKRGMKPVEFVDDFLGDL